VPEILGSRITFQKVDLGVAFSNYHGMEFFFNLGVAPLIAKIHGSSTTCYRVE
jgi:hypothetical protein